MKHSCKWQRDQINQGCSDCQFFQTYWKDFTNSNTFISYPFNSIFLRALILCHPNLWAVFYKVKHFQHSLIWREYFIFMRSLIIFQEKCVEGSRQEENLINLKSWPNRCQNSFSWVSTFYHSRFGTIILQFFAHCHLSNFLFLFAFCYNHTFPIWIYWATATI